MTKEQLLEEFNNYKKVLISNKREEKRYKQGNEAQVTDYTISEFHDKIKFVYETKIVGTYNAPIFKTQEYVIPKYNLESLINLIIDNPYCLPTKQIENLLN
jgi:hypothetical protein